MQTVEAISEDVKERQTERIARNDHQGIVPTGRKCVAVLTPTLGQVSMWWATAVMDLIWPMNMTKAFIPMMDQQGGEIGEMRNRLVAMALASSKNANIEVEAFFWLDDDVIINRLCLLTLAAHDVDIASGVYFCKGETGNEPLIFSGPSSGTTKFKPDSVFESWGWAQGLSLVRAEVYQRMVDELDIGVDKYGNPAWYKKPDFGVDDRGQITLGGTEDFHFFENASRLGYRPLVDCTKHAFGFHYDAGQKTGYPVKQWQQYVRREPIVWQTKEGECVWA